MELQVKTANQSGEFWRVHPKLTRPSFCGFYRCVYSTLHNRSLAPLLSRGHSLNPSLVLRLSGLAIIIFVMVCFAPSILPFKLKHTTQCEFLLDSFLPSSSSRETFPCSFTHPEMQCPCRYLFVMMHFMLLHHLAAKDFAHECPRWVLVTFSQASVENNPPPRAITHFALIWSFSVCFICRCEMERTKLFFCWRDSSAIFFLLFILPHCWFFISKIIARWKDLYFGGIVLLRESFVSVFAWKTEMWLIRIVGVLTLGKPPQHPP